MLCLFGPPALAHAETPPDKVEMKGGGLIRGTIVEKEPGGEVVIQLVTGEIRRIPMSEVNYAGPDARARAEDGGAPEGDETVPLALEANEKGIAFQSYTGSTTGRGVGYNSGSGGISTFRASSDAYSALCIAPCTLRHPEGNFRLGLSKERREVVENDGIVAIDGPGRLVGVYRDRQGVRTAGWVTGIGGGLLGTGLIVAGIVDTQANVEGGVLTEEPNTALLVSGISIGLASGIAAWIMASIRDKAEISFERR